MRGFNGTGRFGVLLGEIVNLQNRPLRPMSCSFVLRIPRFSVPCCSKNRCNEEIFSKRSCPFLRHMFVGTYVHLTFVSFYSFAHRRRIPRSGASAHLYIAPLSSRRKPAPPSSIHHADGNDDFARIHSLPDVRSRLPPTGRYG